MSSMEMEKDPGWPYVRLTRDQMLEVCVQRTTKWQMRKQNISMTLSVFWCLLIG